MVETKSREKKVFANGISHLNPESAWLTGILLTAGNRGNFFFLFLEMFLIAQSRDITHHLKASTLPDSSFTRDLI